MEEKKARKEKEEGKKLGFYTFDENGRQKKFEYPKPSGKLSPLGLWRKEHPSGSIVEYLAATENN
ncbi:hypothetical protein Barb6XT_01922 [Bacteroidales bacterium Barb6XT]|nr:hypothetical protein Barb6XT_01922 [Bacteroidales bacterium Barb6XT]